LEAVGLDTGLFENEGDAGKELSRFLRSTKGRVCVNDAAKWAAWLNIVNELSVARYEADEVRQREVALRN